MKKQSLGLMLIWSVLLVSCGTRKADFPNIILIVADDLGWKDLGFMGSTYYETPHMDRLAGEGMVFTQAYASAANCAPSRACLMTGMYTTKHGIYTVASSERGDARTRRIIPAANTTVLDDAYVTLAEALKKAGYTTINIGKWHLGADPCTQGMDFNVGGGSWGHPKSYFAPFVQPDLEAPEGSHLTDYLTTKAVDFLRNNKTGPFFLYLPYYAVHTPLECKPGLEHKYAAKKAGGCQRHPVYAGMIENLDSCIGSLLEELNNLGLAENTLVVFTSDNGGIRHVSCQDPLRAGKGSYYEGGIRVPLVIRWTGRIREGTHSATPVINLDFFPTFLELTGSEAPADLDGLSLWPLLSGSGSLEDRSLFFHFPVYLEAYKRGKDGSRDPLFRTRPGSVIRKGSWKLHYYYEDGGVELYNLRDDVGETSNLAAVHPEITAELLSRLMRWLDNEQVRVNFEPNPAYDSLYEQRDSAGPY